MNDSLKTVPASQLRGLKPWKPGTSGNPGGRPKSKDLRELVLKDFKQDPAANVKLLKRKRIDLYYAYGFGKPVESVQIRGPDAGPIQIEDATPLAMLREMIARGIELPPALKRANDDDHGGA